MAEKSRFNGEVSLVTGAGSGIGAAIARRLAADGSTVVVTDIDLDAATKVAKEIEDAGGEAISLKLDATSKEDNEAAVAETVERFGALHHAVNNAGITPKPARVGETDLDNWDKVIDLNLNAVAYGLHYQLKQMVTQDDPSKASIVTMSSIHGQTAVPGAAAYTTAKHGVVGLTKNAAAEYGKEGIRINALAPGYVDTPLLKDLDDDRRESLIAKHPLGRLATADEVAAFTSFLLSDEASFSTGGYYLLDGGYNAV